ncbi:hypothetical protein [Cytobacillus gottheilii]|uniref:hypothetical protein n=1 Tax=Cytobacillus gottheilii TaxID=859144 RepID=UPI001594980A|nr:hypothetical protein [Cytobacillus gottheilii]
MKKLSYLTEMFIEDVNNEQSRIITTIEKWLPSMFISFLLIGLPLVGYCMVQLFF